MPLSESLMRAAIRLLGILPEPIQRLLAGPVVDIDGNRLYTEVQLALRILNALPGSNFETLSLPAARAQIDAEARIFGKSYHVDHIEEITIPTRAGSLPARVYRHQPDTPLLGAVVYFHGGGWVLGSLESTDSACRFIAAHLNAVIISVDYRLAPEHPYPAAVHDAIDAYRWVRAQPDWGEIVAVAGDSAGGNLSAVVANETRTSNPPDAQLLFFPVTDLSTEHKSYETFADGFFLTRSQMRWYRGHYAPEQVTDPRVSPLLADLGDGAGVAPAHIALAGYDPLRDEGVAYAHKLQALGVPTTLQIAGGHIHAFTNAAGVSPKGAEASGEAVAALRGLMETARANKATLEKC